jgi:hypothetical protein
LSLGRGRGSRRALASSLRLHRRLGEEAAARLFLMAAPRRARDAGGGFRGGLRLSRKRPTEVGPLRAFSALIARFHKSLTRLMPPGSGQAEVARWDSMVVVSCRGCELRSALQLAGSCKTCMPSTHSPHEPHRAREPAGRSGGGSVRRRRASAGSGPQGAGHGWPAVFAEPWMANRKPPAEACPEGGAAIRHGRAAASFSRGSAAGAAATAPRRLSLTAR